MNIKQLASFSFPATSTCNPFDAILGIKGDFSSFEEEHQVSQKSCWLLERFGDQ